MVTKIKKNDNVNVQDAVQPESLALEFDDIIAKVRGVIAYFQDPLEPHIHKPADIDGSQVIFNLFARAEELTMYNPNDEAVHHILGDLDQKIVQAYEGTLEESLPRQIVILICTINDWKNTADWPTDGSKTIPLQLLQSILEFHPALSAVFNLTIFNAANMMYIQNTASGKMKLHIDSTQGEKIDLANLYAAIAYLHLVQPAITQKDIHNASYLFQVAQGKLPKQVNKDIDPDNDPRYHFIGQLAHRMQQLIEQKSEHCAPQKKEFVRNMGMILARREDYIQVNTQGLQRVHANLDYAMDNCNMLFSIVDLERIEREIDAAKHPGAILRVLHNTKKWLDGIENKALKKSMKRELAHFCRGKNIQLLMSDPVMKLASGIIYKKNTLTFTGQPQTTQNLLASFILLRYETPSVKLLALVQKHVEEYNRCKYSRQAMPREIRQLFSTLELEAIESAIVNRLRTRVMAAIKKPTMAPIKKFATLQESLVKKLRQIINHYTEKASLFNGYNSDIIGKLNASINSVNQAQYCDDLQQALAEINPDHLASAHYAIRCYQEYQRIAQALDQAQTLQDITRTIGVERSPFHGLSNEYKTLKKEALCSSRRFDDITQFCGHVTHPEEHFYQLQVCC